MESSPTDENVETHNRAKALYMREKLQATRKSWYEKTASLNTKKDMPGLWKLVGNLNNDNPDRSKTVIEHDNQLKTGKAAANALADLYQEASTLHMPQQRTKEVREETTLRPLRQTHKAPTTAA